MTANPLLAPWAGPYGGVPPWDRMQAEDFPAALGAALVEERAEIDAIVSNPAPASFDNTIAALERSGRTRDRVERMFSVARESVTDEAIQAIEREWQPKLAAAADAILLNAALFARIDAVHRAANEAGLAQDQRRVAAWLHDVFVRHGARLGSAEKAQLAAINQELASLFSTFRQHVLADENSWTVLGSRDDLAGLPEAFVETLAAAAADRGLDGRWVVVNTRSSVDPFLTASTRRDLRAQVWRAFKQRGDTGNAYDTNATIARIVRLRAHRARLLGFASHAHWRMADTMARTPDAARALMMRVWPAAVRRVHEELADMTAVAQDEGAPLPLEPWDYLHFAEKVRQSRYALDQAAITPYFELDQMVAAALWSAERRYGLVFAEITGQVPVFHPEVRVWEVRDAETGAHRGVFYLDNFARPGKRSGAWASEYREQHRLDGPVAPLVSNNNNFVKAPAGEPTLLSLDDVRTLFHEFGHALHSLLQDVRYPSLGTTPRDFVEFPSQINEHWVLTRDVLDRFARHCRTGDPMPDALVEKIARAGKFNQGYATIEYLAAAIVDMDLHTRPDGVADPPSFERDALARLGMPREIALRHRLPHFDHLFGSDSYSAGYYSYLWSDVMAADTWRAFETAPGGPWDEALLGRMREHLLSNGNATDRAEAYRAFLGRDPDVAALFEERGFPIP
ncbi:MAG: M3 family metallopeptidase [Acidobacteria bacterium]|nr:M3 family metallopeptidase [Acidobacteriota bacterium]